jgi:hypothetical protein
MDEFGTDPGMSLESFGGEEFPPRLGCDSTCTREGLRLSSSRLEKLNVLIVGPR